jgi:hypothetical protein
LNPDVDVETLLRTGLPSAGAQEAIIPSPKSPEQVDEASPGSSHEYEWHEAPLSTDDEQVQSLRDGMALLSTDPSASGYLGKYKSNVLPQLRGSQSHRKQCRFQHVANNLLFTFAARISR